MTQSKYGKSIEKLEEIVRRIENEEIDVDELALKVKEAAGLVKECKEKIAKAEMEVKNVVEKLDEE